MVKLSQACPCNLGVSGSRFEFQTGDFTFQVETNVVELQFFALFIRNAYFLEFFSQMHFELSESGDMHIDNPNNI